MDAPSLNHLEKIGSRVLSSKTVYGSVLLGGVLLVGGALAVNYLWLTPEEPTTRVAEVPEPEEPLKPVVVPDGYVEHGGVLRPESDVQPQKSLELPDFGDNTIGKRIGSSPPVDPNTNAYTKSVATALKEPAKYPERLGPMFPAKAFDPEVFEEDPETYLTTVEPGRVWQAADPGEGVKRLKRTSSGYQRVLQGESVELKVETVPGSPVTFHSFKLGQFDNQLTTMSVRADSEGVAYVNFKATGGTYGELEILAASPQASGQVQFVVKVDLPKLVSN